MSTRKRLHLNKAVVAGLAAAAALAGGAGVAAASSPTAAQPEAAPARQAGPQGDKAEREVKGSLAAPEVEGEDEQQEADRLAAIARVSQAQAEETVLAAVPGKVSGSELGDENGSVIWEVHVLSADGSAVEVKVDAGNGQVLAEETDDDGEAEDGVEAEESAEDEGAEDPGDEHDDGRDGEQDDDAEVAARG